MPTFTMDTEQYRAQLRHAGRVDAEYRRRLAAEGFEFGEGAMHDCLKVSSEKEAERVSEIFSEVCDELSSC